VLSDRGQTQGATFKQRSGWTGSTSWSARSPRASVRADESDAAVGRAVAEATGRPEGRCHPGPSAREPGRSRRDRAGIGNLGLIYLMQEPRRLSIEEIQERHPRLLATLRHHPHIGFPLVRSRQRGPVVLGAPGVRYLDGDLVEGEDPLAPFPPSAAAHLRRTDGFEHVADIIVNSFYDPELEGLRVRGADLLPGRARRPAGPAVHPSSGGAGECPVVGAAAVRDRLVGWGL